MKMHVLWTAALLMSSGVITQRVDQSRTSLTGLPASSPPNVTDLILSHNSITMSVSDIKTLQRYSMIRVLDLSYNLIKTLPSGAFDKLTNLETLILRGNRLQTLDKDVFKGLTKLTSLDLEENPWKCSCLLTGLIQQLNDSGTSVGKGVSCYTLQNTTVPDVNSFCSGRATSVERSRSTATAPSAGSTPSTAESSTGGHINSSSKGFIASGDGTQTGSNSWKFLLGVVVLALSTSVLIVCAVKSPSWYKLLFNYRHQRLREDVEHSIFNTGRFSNFSLDTEQTETSTQELDEGLEPFEDDGGFIEDVYIEPGSYSENADANESID